MDTSNRYRPFEQVNGATVNDLMDENDRLAEELVAAKAQIAMLIPGLDEHWVTTQEGKQALSATSADVEAWLRKRDAKVRLQAFEDIVGLKDETQMQMIAELRKNGGK